jgi:hypothetical protein
MARIRPEDAAQAVSSWASAAPKQYKPLIFAGADNSALGYDPERLVYYVRQTGRIVAPQTIHQALNATTDAWSRSMELQAGRMIRGEIDLATWQQQMAAQMKSQHTASMILGKGGVAQVTEEDALYLEGELRFQYERLNRFAIQIQNGERIAASEGVIKTRVEMYSEAAVPTYEEARRAGAQDAGADEERRVLGQAEHCDTCIIQAALGWSPIGSLNRIGQSECLMRCRCHFEYKAKKKALEKRPPGYTVTSSIGEAPKLPGLSAQTKSAVEQALATFGRAK